MYQFKRGAGGQDQRQLHGGGDVSDGVVVPYKVTTYPFPYTICFNIVKIWDEILKNREMTA